jgi:DNA-binding beta-propeller fold protein YncE
MLLVCNKGDETLGLMDVEARREVAAVPVGGVTGHEVAASPDGRTAYVPIYGNSGVGQPGSDGDRMVAIDLAERRVAGTVDFGKGVRPHLPVFDPASGMVYVTTELEEAITIVDPRTLRVAGLIPTGQAESHMLAITRDGRRGYTANVGPGTVSVLDMAERKTMAVIPVSKRTQRIAISPDDKLVFTADQAEPRMAVIDTESNQVTSWVALPGRGFGSTPTPDGCWLLVTLPATRQLAVVDLSAMKVAQVLDVPAAPQAVVVRTDGREAYVSCDASGQIAVIDCTRWTVEGTMAAGAGPDGLGWA